MHCHVVDEHDRAGSGPRPGTGPDDAASVLAARAGDPDAFGLLFTRWFDPVYDVAWRIVRNPDTAAEVAQDVFLAAWQGLDRLENPGSFGGWVRRIARNRALNRLERERRSRPDDAAAEAALDRTAPEVDMTGPLGERDQRELVWAAAAALGERDTSLLDLHLRHGLAAGEIADELGVTPNNAHQLLHRLKGKLAGAMRAWVLWRDGAQRCPVLDRALDAAGLSAFGGDAVRVIGRHARDCDRCAERQQLRLAPEALFAAVPLVVAPPLLRAEAAAALGEAGVPMAGAASGAAGAGGPATDRAGEMVGSGAGHGGPGSGAADGPEPGGGPGGATSGPLPPGGGVSRRLALVGAVVLLVMAAGLGALAVTGGGGGGDPVATLDASSPAPEVGAREADVGPARPGGTKPPPPRSTTTTSGDEPGTAGTAETAGSPGTGPSTPEGPETTGSTAEPGEPPPPTPPPTPEADPPVIDGFRASLGAGCGSDRNARLVTLAWQSTGGDSASLAGPGVTTSQPPSGSTTACVVPPAQFTLTVAGPGGSASAAAAVP